MEKNASIGQRASAFFVDILLLNLSVSLPLSLYAETMMDFAVFSLIASIFYQIYFTYMEGRYGQTIGKEILKIKLKNPDFKKSFLRNISKSFFPLMPFILVVDSIPLFLKGERILDSLTDSEVRKVWKS